MYCHKCAALLPNEVKFCPNCGARVLELNDTRSDSVELDITSDGVDNELFSNMKFDIFADDVHIGAVPGNGTTAYKITPGKHCIKIGTADIQINIPKDETSVKLAFIWGPNIEQRIVCQQSQFVTKSSEPETVTLQTTSSKKQKILALGLGSIVVVLAVAVLAIIVNSRHEDYVSSVSEYSQDSDFDENNSNENDSDKNDTNKAIDISDQSSAVVDVDEVRKAYIQKVQELTAQDSTYLFDLIDLDGDDVLELVAERTGYDISLFTWFNGDVVTLMDEWVYGAMGNNGYGYLPGRNVIYNYDMDQGGAIIYESFWAMNRYNEVARLSGETITICYFNDANRNRMIDEGEEFCEEPFYYYGDTEITEEEYESYQFQGEYEWISGKKTFEEILRQLKEEK